MKIIAFALRNTKEIVRDKVNLMFGIAFPIVLILLLSFIQSNIPKNLFAIEELTPGIVVFGFSFMSLFSGMLIAKDRESSLFLRLFTSPLTASNFIYSYFIPFIPLAIIQATICFTVAVILGLSVSINILFAIIVLTPVMILYISIGLLCGSIFNDKQVGGVCGALLTNISAWLSDTWFDVNLVGGVYAGIAKSLPFYHAVQAGRNALKGDYTTIFPHLWWVIGYAVVITVIAVYIFSRKMNGDSI